MSPLIFFVGRPQEKLGDRYELIDELGRGSFGVVWKARRLDNNELVALKIPRDQELGEEVLRREPDLVRAFSHPNIVKVHGVHTIGGLFVIEMELVDGYSLAQILDGVGPQRPLSFRQVLLWTQQILSGLSVVHAEAVVHGDIKPQNILVDRTGQAKLVDFGTSRHLSDVWVWTKRQGTEPYWAPEVAIDERRSLISDIYSLGVVLYEMVTGRLPYHSPYELLAGRQVQRPREINPDVPPSIEQVVLKAMAREPGNRYLSCEAMLQDVEQVLEMLSQLPATRKSERTEPSRVSFRLDSSSPLYYLEQAKSRLAEDDLQGAMVAAEAAVDRSGGHPNYLRLLAGICLRLGYQRRAIEAYERVLRAYEGQYPGRADQVADVLERLAQLYIVSKQYHRAIPAYERLLSLATNKPYARFRLAVAYGLDGQYRKAIELLEVVRQERPEIAVVSSKLGWAHMAAGNIRSALAYYNQALVLDPADLFSLYELGHYFLILGDRSTAHRYFERLRAVDRLELYAARIRMLEEH
ncbi:MAG TPA: hypothetical protein DEP84_28085 [Chloroflexi bacterium]|nr:hypothetical protein [Chloroflexota bacterium]